VSRGRRTGVRVIAGSARGLRLATPAGDATRPTTDRVKESVFAALGDALLREAAVLDLYAGSGALAIEALSRGAERALLVERDRAAVEAIRANLDKTGFVDRARVERGAVETVLRGDVPREAPFDVVLLDPPYDSLETELDPVLLALALPGWLARGASVIIERPARATPLGLPKTWETSWRRNYGDTLVLAATV
jgi:16S rRNA (guanine966-N2)-methyltransferase